MGPAHNTQGKLAICLAVTALLLGAQCALVAVAPAYLDVKRVDVGAILHLILLLVIPAIVAIAVVPLAVTLPRSRLAIVVMVAAGLAMRMAWLGAAAPLEDDFNRYLWDGAMTAAGLDPYAFSPLAAAEGRVSDPAVERLAKQAGPILGRINFPDLRSIYPGTAQVFFAVSHLIVPWSIDGLRLGLLTSELAAVVAMLALLRHSGRSPYLAALYWLNPLVVFAGIGTVHYDVLLAPLLLGTMLAAQTRRPRVSAALLGLAVGAKFWPVLLAPLVFAELIRTKPGAQPQTRTWALETTVVFALVVAATTGPAMISALSAQSGLVAYATDWHVNNAPYAWASYAVYLALGPDTGGQAALRLSCATAAGAVALWQAHAHWRPDPDASGAAGRICILQRTAIVTAALFYLSPAQFPWYALWFLPFAALTGNRALLLASATLPAYYFFFPLAESGRRDLFSYGVAAFHSAPVFIWLLTDRFRRRVLTRPVSHVGGTQ